MEFAPCKMNKQMIDIHRKRFCKEITQKEFNEEMKKEEELYLKWRNWYIIYEICSIV